jgi:hypothetical protein
VTETAAQAATFAKAQKAAAAKAKKANAAAVKRFNKELVNNSELSKNYGYEYEGTGGDSSPENYDNADYGDTQNMPTDNPQPTTSQHINKVVGHPIIHWFLISVVVIGGFMLAHHIYKRVT